MKSETGSIFSSSTIAKATYKGAQHPHNQTVGSIISRRGYNSVNRSQIFTEKVKEKSNMQRSIILDRYNRAYEDSIKNEM